MDLSIVKFGFTDKKWFSLGREEGQETKDIPTEAKGLWNTVLAVWLNVGHEFITAGGRLRTRTHPACSHKLSSTASSSSPCSMRYHSD